MLVLETVVRIRREYAGGKAIKAIARDLHVSRKVIRKAIRAPEGAFDYQRKVQPLPRIGPFQDRLNTLLEENEVRGRRERLRMTRIHDLLEREGFEGSYDAVRRYAARWKADRRKDAWDWTMLIPLPPAVTEADIAAGLDAAARKKPELPIDRIGAPTIDEGLSLQILHVGSYDAETPTLHRLHAELMPAQGLTFNGPHHEIYLSDPRRVAPEKLKTILRQPVRAAG